MVTIVAGLTGGLVATIVMTAFMLALGDDSSPPTALFWSTYVADGPPEDQMMPGMVLHILYGTAAGGVFAAVVPALGFVDVSAVGPGVLWGLAYGVVLFVGAAIVWMKLVLDMDPEPQEAAMMGLFHLIYGAVLGGWLGYGILA